MVSFSKEKLYENNGILKKTITKKKLQLGSVIGLTDLCRSLECVEDTNNVKVVESKKYFSKRLTRIQNNLE